MTRRAEQAAALAGRAGRLVGAELNKASATRFLATERLGAIPDYLARPQMVVQGLIAEDDRVGAVLHLSGVPAGSLVGHAAAGRRIGVRGLALLRLRDRVVQEWEALWDTVTLARQLYPDGRGSPAEAEPVPASLATGVEGRLARTAQLFTVSRDRAAAAEYLGTGDPTRFRGNFPRSAVTVESLTTESGRVVASVVGSGVHTAYALGLAPTGRAVRARGLVVMSLSGGLVTGCQVLWDNLSVHRQLTAGGVATAPPAVRVPEPAAPAAPPTPPVTKSSTLSRRGEADWEELSRKEAAKREAARYMDRQAGRFISDFRMKSW
jgi:predicted ester cyclase